MKNKYRCESVRLCRFLYGLGFDKESIEYKGQEAWLFEKTNELQESLDFFFYMRKKIKNLKFKGANEHGTDHSKKMDFRRGSIC